MRREYDVFEKFRDGSTRWRATVVGRFEALRKMQEFREHSDNDFFTIDVVMAKPFKPKLVKGGFRPMVKTATVAKFPLRQSN